jgi:excinuclease ABC subunit C
LNSQLEEKLADLPVGTGVYLMKDRHGEVLYVGKAVNLRGRVRSYFAKAGGDSRAFIPLLEGLVADIDKVLVRSEKEALLLENELIKKYRPRFNVQLRDDKNFICLRLDVAHPYPRLEVVRRFKRDGAVYFGPYSSASSIRESLRIINRYFQLRTCSDYALQKRRRPCLLYQIGRCPAPCVYPIAQEEYRRSVEEVILFLHGKTPELTEGLRWRIQDAAGKLNFEEAARVRDQLRAIQRSLERQQVALSEPIDEDVFSLHREDDRLVIYALYVRMGRITGGQAFSFSGQEFPNEELLGSFVNLYYADENFIPKEVLLPVDPGGLESLSALLSERKGERVRILVPKRGEKVDLVRISQRNAEQAFRERKRTKEEADQLLESLQRRLHLPVIPRRIECYDVSHFQGSTIVASLVAMTDGEIDKSRYRRFKIKSVNAQDDFASMYEVLLRRLRRAIRENDLPDLVVIDGGKGQLASALAAMKDAGASGIEMVALAKSRDLEVHDNGKGAVRSPERVFLANRKDPIVLPQSSAELFLLTRLRDEAHRFAITFQQSLMRRRNLRSALEDIPGVGGGRKKALLKHFGSLKRVRGASIEELAAVEGLGSAVAERIHAFLHGAARDNVESEDAIREASLEDAKAV